MILKEKCFMCGNEDIEIFEGEGILIFKCKSCSVKWGKFDIREKSLPTTKKHL